MLGLMKLCCIDDVGEIIRCIDDVGEIIASGLKRGCL